MSTACEEIIVRLSTDKQFRQQFQANRRATIAEFALSDDERADLLVFEPETLDDDPGLRRLAGTVCAMRGGVGD